MSTYPHYPTNLTDEQWYVLQALLPESKRQPGGPGRPPLNLRRVLDGIFYVNKTGCQWRMMLSKTIISETSRPRSWDRPLYAFRGGFKGAGASSTDSNIAANIERGF